MDRVPDSRVSEIVRHALGLPGDEVARYVAEACADDEALRSRVDGILRDRTRTGDWLDPPEATPEPAAPDVARLDPCASIIGSTIGPYRILAHIADGGMGTVFEAQQESPARRVALKIMHASFVSAAASARFRYEAEALARLTHPGIAQVFDAGTHRGPTGFVSYYTMELISGGRSVLEQARTLGRRARLELFLLLCDAVAHAHRRGVIHRDLKPSNVLVTPEGHLKVLDFGIAKLIERPDAEATFRTQTGQMLGTPGYMSPEQARGDPSGVDVRSDVFSMGVMLYEMLTDHQPFATDSASPFEIARAVAERDPIPARAFDHALRGDLENILSRALEKDREHRYQSVDALAHDVRAFLTDRPVAARPPSAAYAFRKFAARNRALILGAVGVLLALVVGLGVAAWQAVVATAARERSDRFAAISRLREYTAKIQAAAGSLELNDGAAARLHLDATPTDLRGWEWRYLHSQLDLASSAFAMPNGVDAATTGIAVSRDGRHALVCYENRAIALHEVRSGRVVTQWDEKGGEEAPNFNRPTFSPDGRHLLVSRQYGATFEIRDAGTLAVERTVTGIAFEALGGGWSPDGRRIAVTGGSPRTSEKSPARLMVIDVETGKHVCDDVLSSEARFDNPCFLADGEHVLCTLGSSPVIVDLHDGSMRRLPVGMPSADGAGLFAAPSGSRFALVSNAGAQIFELPEGRSYAMLGRNRPEAMCFGPDSSSLYVAAGDSVERWELATGKRSLSLRCSTGIRAFAVTPDGTRLLVAGDGSGVRVFDTELPGAGYLNIPARDSATPSPDFSTIAYSSPDASHANDGRVFFRDTATGTRLSSAALGGSWPPTGGLLWSPDRAWLLRVQPHVGLGLLRLSDQSEHHMESDRGWDRCEFLPDGTHLLACRTGGLDILTLPGLEVEREIPLRCPPADGHRLAAMFADGRIVVRHSEPGKSATVAVLDWPSAREVARWECRDLLEAFSASANLVAAGADLDGDGTRGEVRLYDLLSGRLLARSPSLPSRPRALLLDAEHGRVYAGLFDRSVVVLGIATLPQDRDPTLVEILTLHTDTSWIENLFLSEDGMRLMATTVYPSNRALIWDARPMKERVERSAAGPNE